MGFESLWLCARPKELFTAKKFLQSSLKCPVHLRHCGQSQLEQDLCWKWRWEVWNVRKGVLRTVQVNHDKCSHAFMCSTVKFSSGAVVTRAKSSSVQGFMVWHISCEVVLAVERDNRCDRCTEYHQTLLALVQWAKGVPETRPQKSSPSSHVNYK